MTHTTVSSGDDAAQLARLDQITENLGAASPTAAAPGVARVIGLLFLAGFLTYGVGSALVNSVTSSTNFLTTLPEHRTTLVLGVFLMFLNTAVDVAKAVLLYPILERHSKKAALAYLSAMIVEVVLLSVGVLGLLALIPLSQHAADGAGVSPDWKTTVGTVFLDWNTMSYQLGEIALACGALVLCAVLYRTRLLPRFLAVWGLAGYLILMTGAVSEVFGGHIGLALSLPGGLWEVTLGLWLIIRGFALRPGVDRLGHPHG